MSNAERIALTRKQEFGYDEFNNDHYEFKAVKVLVRGKVIVFKPKEVA